MSAVRSSFGLENFHILNKDCEKHFRNMSATQSNLHDSTKLENFSETNNTPWGHCIAACKKDLSSGDERSLGLHALKTDSPI